MIQSLHLKIHQTNPYPFNMNKEFWVNSKGEVVGFRPESEGITLEEAFIKLTQNQ